MTDTTDVTRTETVIPAVTTTVLEVTLTDGSKITAQQSDNTIQFSNAISMLNFTISPADSPLLRSLLEAAEQEWATNEGVTA